MCKAAAATAGALDCVEVTVIIFPEANADVTVVVVVGMVMATIRGLLAAPRLGERGSLRKKDWNGFSMIRWILQPRILTRTLVHSHVYL